VTKDDGPRASSTLEKLSELPEAFGGGGVTAGNSCPLNDGAAAVLLMSDTKAKELGLTPRARIVTAATYGNEPELMGVAPIGAIKKVLDRAGMTMEDVDTVELNEAFAAQIPIMDECDIAPRSSTPRWRDRPRPPFDDWRPHHGHLLSVGDRRPPGRDRDQRASPGPGQGDAGRTVRLSPDEGLCPLRGHSPSRPAARPDDPPGDGDPGSPASP
jgi:hypothetical protein